MSNIKHVSYYTNVMQQWGRELGPKPTEAQLATAHVHGRPGKQSLIVAMALRPEGVTGNQMQGASALFDGKATKHLNHMRALVNAKMFTRLPVPGCYALEIGPKHQQFADLHGAKAAAEQPAKAEKQPSAKSKRKAERKAKVKAATTPAAPTETATSGQMQAVVAMPEQPAA